MRRPAAAAETEPVELQDPAIEEQAEEADEITEEILKLAGGKGSSLGTGGMKTKLTAAGICTEAGCDMIIANGSNPQLLYDIADGKAVGTRFLHHGTQNG